MENTTQIERAEAIKMLHAAQEMFCTKLDRLFEPVSISLALTPQDVAALMDFAEEN